MDDTDLWEWVGKGCSFDLIDYRGFNVHIFDRLSLAAFWKLGTEKAFCLRARRGITADKHGWQTFGIGARLWKGTASYDIDNLIKDYLIADINAFIPSNGSELPNEWVKGSGYLQVIEGFILGGR